MGRFTDYILRIAPDYLGDQLKLLASFGQASDECNSQLERAARNVYLDKAEGSMLDAHGINSNLSRVRLEPNERYITELKRRWIAWEASGSRNEMVHQIGRLGYAEHNINVVTYNDLFDAGRFSAFGNTSPNPDERFPNFWFLAIGWPPLEQLPNTSARWGSNRKWGEKPNGPVWGGVGIANAELNYLRQIIFKWKPEHTSCRFIVIATNNTFVLDGNYDWPRGSAIVYPVNEWWEIDPMGAVTPFYNYSPYVK